MAIRKPPFDDTAIRPAALSEAELDQLLAYLRHMAGRKAALD